MSGDEPFFVDTNLLIYAVDPTAGVKYEAAQHWMKSLWASGRGRLSWQVLNEFYSAAVRKTPLAPVQAREVVLPLLAWQPIGMSPAILKRAWHWTDQAQLAYWDALIVATAELSGCPWLLTEDLQDQRILGTLTILNPFRVGPHTVGLTI